MEIYLKIAGVLLMILALLHLFFPNYFNWKQELRPLNLINRQMMYVHAFFIALSVLLMGLLCLTSAIELTTTAFGKRISLGLSIFWALRLFIQFFGYSSLLWKGKVPETIVHVLLSMLWIYLSAIFLLAYLA
jgi:hypothetical protein